MYALRQVRPGKFVLTFDGYVCSREMAQEYFAKQANTLTTISRW